MANQPIIGKKVGPYQKENPTLDFIRGGVGWKAIMENIDARLEAWSRVLAIAKRPFASPPRESREPVSEYQPWRVYWYTGEGSGGARVSVSHIGRIFETGQENAEVGVLTTNRLDGDGCNHLSAIVEEDYIIYIEVAVAEEGDTLVVSSAKIVIDAKSAGGGAYPGAWDVYPALVRWDGDGIQDRLWIPLAVTKDVSSMPLPSAQVGPFTLLPGGLGLYQLYPASDITIELSTYLSQAALLPNPFPKAIF